MMLTSRQPMRQNMKDQMPLYLFIFVLFGTGTVFGAVMVGALSLEQNQELARQMTSFFQTIHLGTGLEPANSFQQSLGLNVKWILLIWIMGLSVVGLPIVFALDFLKGVLVGFSVGYLIGEYSWKGALFALVSIVPQNLIIVPAIVLASAAAVAFSTQLVKNRFGTKQGTLYSSLMRYTGTAFTMLLLMAGTALYEAYLSPAVMDWVAPMLLSL